jgi:hypothetical protein
MQIGSICLRHSSPGAAFKMSIGRVEDEQKSGVDRYWLSSGPVITGLEDFLGRIQHPHEHASPSIQQQVKDNNGNLGTKTHVNVVQRFEPRRAVMTRSSRTFGTPEENAV